MIYDAALALETDRAYRTVDIERQRRHTCAALRLTDNQRVVDIGCGSGLLLEELAKQVGPGGEAVGIDSSPEMLALARQRCDSLPQVVLTEGTTTDLAGYCGHFDAASCVQVLLYIDDTPLALEQIHRSLRPDGRLVIVETDWRGALLSEPSSAEPAAANAACAGIRTDRGCSATEHQYPPCTRYVLVRDHSAPRAQRGRERGGRCSRCRELAGGAAPAEPRRQLLLLRQPLPVYGVTTVTAGTHALHHL